MIESKLNSNQSLWFKLILLWVGFSSFFSCVIDLFRKSAQFVGRSRVWYHPWCHFLWFSIAHGDDKWTFVFDAALTGKSTDPSGSAFCSQWGNQAGVTNMKLGHLLWLFIYIARKWQTTLFFSSVDFTSLFVQSILLYHPCFFEPPSAPPSPPNHLLFYWRMELECWILYGNIKESDSLPGGYINYITLLIKAL